MLLSFGLSACSGIFEPLAGLGAGASEDPTERALAELWDEITVLHEALAERDAALAAQEEALAALTADAAADVVALEARVDAMEALAEVQQVEAAQRDAQITAQQSALASVDALISQLTADLGALAASQNVRTDLINMGNMIAALQNRLGAVERDAATQLWVTEQGFARMDEVLAVDAALRVELAALAGEVAGVEGAVASHDAAIADLGGVAEGVRVQARQAAERADAAVVAADAASASASASRGLAEEALVRVGQLEASQTHIGEQVASLEQRLDTAQTQASQLGSHLDGIAGRLDGVEAELMAVSQAPGAGDAALTMEVVELWLQLEELRSESAWLQERDAEQQFAIDDLGEAVSALQGSGDGSMDAAALARIEADLRVLTARVDDTWAALDALDDTTSALAAGQSLLSTDVQRLQASGVVLRTAVGGLARTVRTVDARVDAVVGDADELWAAVEHLDQRVSLIEGDVDLVAMP